MKPILFSAQMVKAIIDGRKTQTRRVIKPQPEHDIEDAPFLCGSNFVFTKNNHYGNSRNKQSIVEPKYKVNDVLYVRETWRLTDFSFIDDYVSARVTYKDGGSGDYLRNLKHGMNERTGWRPSIHMPRAAARIFLRVINVRAERVQDISENDAIAEGVALRFGSDGVLRGYKNYLSKTSGTIYVKAADSFKSLWIFLNAKRGHGWDANPWVQVYKFERITKEAAMRNEK
jgi:hypothetical protein